MRLYERLADLADCLRYEDAARLRDRIASLERVVDQLARLDRLRRVEACLLVPALDAGATDAFFVAAGRVVARRTLSRGAGARAKVEEALWLVTRAAGDGPANDPDDLDDLLVVGAFLRRPPPELRVLPLDREQILASLGGPFTAAT